jgi:hypothetical protein
MTVAQTMSTAPLCIALYDFNDEGNADGRDKECLKFKAVSGKIVRKSKFHFSNPRILGIKIKFSTGRDSHSPSPNRRQLGNGQIKDRKRRNIPIIIRTPQPESSSVNQTQRNCSQQSQECRTSIPTKSTQSSITHQLPDYTTSSNHENTTKV